MKKPAHRHDLSFAVERLALVARRVEKSAKRRWWLDRAFSGSTPERLLLVTVGDRVAQSQIEPFHAYADALRRRFGTEIREVPVEAYLRGARPAARDATTVCLQTWFDIPPRDLWSLIDTLEAQNPGARLVYLDWFSPIDLRLAEALCSRVSLYVKRHLSKDRTRYGQPTYGDTNLTDHYGRRFGIEEEPRCFAVPRGFFDRLVVGPSFVTADYIRRAADAASPPDGERSIDVHARLGSRGTPWYRCMRAEAQAALEPILDLRVAAGAGVHPVAYLRELRDSKICFSPFGYGEVCWRDYEAIVSGAVLLKPDTSHVETDPDVFVANETYVPIRWDYADLEDKVRWLIGRPRERKRLAENAFAVLRDYVRDEAFADHVARILGEAPGVDAMERGREAAAPDTPSHLGESPMDPRPAPRAVPASAGAVSEPRTDAISAVASAWNTEGGRHELS